MHGHHGETKPGRASLQGVPRRCWIIDSGKMGPPSREAVVEMLALLPKSAGRDWLVGDRTGPLMASMGRSRPQCGARLVKAFVDQLESLRFSPLAAFNAQAKTSRCKRKRAPKAAKCPGRLASEAFNDAGLRWRTGSAGGPPCPLAGPHLHPPRNLRMRAACLPRSFARQSGLLPSWTPMPSIAWCDGAEQGALAVDALFWAFASPNPRAGGDRAAPFAVIA